MTNDSQGLSPWCISRKGLAAIYGVVPLSWCIVLADLTLGQGHLRTALAYAPESYLLFALFFNLPHIMGSLISFADSQYLAYYRLNLLTGLPVILAGVCFLPSLLGLQNYLAFIFLWTICHVIGQQFGLTRMMTGQNGRLFHLWKNLGLVLGIIVFFATFSTRWSWSARWTVMGVSTVLLLPFAALSFLLAQRSINRIGKLYVWLNFALMASSYFFFTENYPFFVILGPRIVHDCTAFYFYIVHDRNRNLTQRQNRVYRLFEKTQISIGLLCPLLAIFIAFPLTCFRHHWWVFQVSAALSLIHYYTDRFIWRHPSPHRNALVFD